MNESSQLRRDRPTYNSVGWTLLGGLLLSIVVMVLGLLLVAIRGGNTSTVLALDEVLSRLAKGEPAAVLDLGILLLFATPLAGIVVALARFAGEGDSQFAVISLVLLVILALGFAIALR